MVTLRDVVGNLDTGLALKCRIASPAPTIEASEHGCRLIAMAVATHASENSH